jgi:hypothetical protein
MGIGGRPGPGVFAAVDVHYLSSGGARAAAVVAADAAFSDVLAERFAVVPEVLPGRFRLPDALRRADVLARTGGPALTQTS